jgi:hypothetical protein
MSAEHMSPSGERFLRYWAVNMTEAFRASSDAWWPGFAYTAEEKARMKEIAEDERIGGGAMLTFYAVLVVGFIVFAGICVVGVLVPVIQLMYPDPSKLQPLPFLLVLACVVVLCLGLGLPLSMRLGAWAGDAWSDGAPLPSKAGDAALLAKVRYQLRRVAFIAAGVLVPGTLLFILYDIDGGPIVLWLKLALGAAIILSLAGTQLGRR